MTDNDTAEKYGYKAGDLKKVTSNKGKVVKSDGLDKLAQTLKSKQSV